MAYSEDFTYSKISIKDGRFAERQKNSASPSPQSRFGRALRHPKPLRNNGKPAKSVPKHCSKMWRAILMPIAMKERNALAAPIPPYTKH